MDAMAFWSAACVYVTDNTNAIRKITISQQLPISLRNVAALTLRKNKSRVYFCLFSPPKRQR